MLIHFISQFPTRLFNLKVDAEWFSEKRKSELLICEKLSNGMYGAYSKTGEPLIYLCAENYDGDSDNWLLK